MTIQLLGTGAADGVPALFTECRVGPQAFDPGNKNCRTRAAGLIEGCIKLDLGPDTLAQIQRNNLNPLDWEAIVFTHSHEDHFTVSELQYALYPFNDSEFAPFTIYCNPTVKWLIEARYPDWPFEIVQTNLFETIEIAGCRMTPVRAKHAEPEECQNLIFEKGGRTFGYMTDTGWWPDETWRYLKDVRFDAMVIECTDGLNDSGYDGHLSLCELKEVLAKLRGMGTVNERTPIYTTHHSHLGGTHEELLDAMKPIGAQPAYDGL